MTVQNLNVRQETDSAVGFGPLNIGLMKTSCHSERMERLEGNQGSAMYGTTEVSCIENVDGSRGLSFFERVILRGLNAKNQGTRVRFSPGIHGLIGIVLAVVLAMAGCGAWAQSKADETEPASTTVVVFADRPLQETQWNGLFGALRAVLTSGGTETELLDEKAEFVRGDSLRAGFRVQSAIVVYLHGDCVLAPLPRRTAYSVPLGWVLKVHGRIEPFAHVDCTRIGQELGAKARGMDAGERNAVMVGAMARVIVHEWIHIAGQSSSHSERGIEKAQYGEGDLMAGGGD